MSPGLFISASCPAEFGFGAMFKPGWMSGLNPPPSDFISGPDFDAVFWTTGNIRMRLGRASLMQGLFLNASGGYIDRAYKVRGQTAGLEAGFALGAQPDNGFNRNQFYFGACIDVFAFSELQKVIGIEIMQAIPLP